jgi:hypothetical protein
MEEWQEIINFPNYSVSNFGNVKNNKTNKLMKINVKGGYCHISLKNETSKKSFKIHRLVASAFIPNPENKPEVNHEDKNKLNNNVENLTWMTRKENNQHKSIGLIYKSNKNKPIIRLNLIDEILDNYNSIEDAGQWAFENKLTKNSHNGRNAIGNCVNGLSNKAYGFKWKYTEKNDLESEEWREFDFKKIFRENILIDKKYYVSNLGRFKNSYGIIMDNYKTNENGYIRVYIHKKTFALHRLVAITFLENPENKETVNHKDGNKINNNVNNLEFATNKEQQIHKFEIGLGNNFTRKVKQYDLNMNLIKIHNSIADAGRNVGVHKNNIWGVINNLRKTSGGFIWKYLD